MAKNKELDFNLEDLKNFLPEGAEEQKRWGFIALAPFVGFLLFVFMVLLVSTGDAGDIVKGRKIGDCLLYTSPSPRDATLSRMPSSA